MPTYTAGDKVSVTVGAPRMQATAEMISGTIVKVAAQYIIVKRDEPRPFNTTSEVIIGLDRIVSNHANTRS